jgi:hypothetical protein
MVVRLLVLGALVVAVIVQAGEAWAGCGTTCSVTAEPAVVDPPLACLDIDVVESECQCGVNVQFFNACTAPLDFSRADLDGCYSDPAACEVIAPNQSNYKQIPASADGHLRSSFVFSENGVEHTVTVDAEVSNFEDVSCACRSAGVASPRGHTGACVLLAAGFSLTARRRRGRSGRALRA